MDRRSNAQGSAALKRSDSKESVRTIASTSTVKSQKVTYYGN